MPRQLALLLCTAFVIYLLRYDRRQPYKASLTLWMPTLWMLLTASRSIDAWLGVTGGNRISGGVLDPFFQSALLFFGLNAVNRRRLNWSAVINSNAWLFALLAYMLISVLWSDMPARSLRSWIREIVALLMALVVLTQTDQKQAIQSVLRRTAYVLIPFSVLLTKYYPDLGVLYSKYSGELQWTGVTLQKNSLGQLCLISIFFLIWTLFRRWRKEDVPVAKYQTSAEILLLLMALWLLRGPSKWAASASATAALSVGFITFGGLLWMRKAGIRPGATACVIVTACIIVLGTVTPFVGGSTVAGFTSTLGRDATLTGRTEIWAGLIPDVMDAPFLGHGFSGFWSPKRTIEHQIGEAHNGYLDVWLQLGFVGLLLTVAFLLSSARMAQRLFESDFEWGCLCLCFVFMTATQTMAESSLGSFNTQMMAVVLFLSFSRPVITRSPVAITQIDANAGGYVPRHQF